MHCSQGGDEAIDAVIGMWYSIALTSDQALLATLLLTRTPGIGLQGPLQEMEPRLLRPGGCLNCVFQTRPLGQPAAAPVVGGLARQLHI